MRNLALLALILFKLSIVHAQSVSSSVINTTGNSYTQGYYSFDWSVGEMALVQTNKSQDGKLIVTNGFLQPALTNDNPDHHFTGDEVKIFPSPTNGKIEIDLTTQQQGPVRIRIFDANGRLMMSRETVSNGTGSIERFDLTHLAAGTYFLSITLDPAMGSIPKTGSFKIIKL